MKVFSGWYIQVCRKGFLSKQWQVRFYDGLSAEVYLELRGKETCEDFADGLLEQICKGYLEDVKQAQPSIFTQILTNWEFRWNTGGPMGYIPIGLIAQKLYPKEAREEGAVFSPIALGLGRIERNW